MMPVLTVVLPETAWQDSCMSLMTHPELTAPISAAVRALMGAANISTVDLAADLGMQYSKLYRRLRKHDWYAEEVALIAAYFGRSPQDLFDGNVGYVVEPRVGIEPTAIRLHCRRSEPFDVQPLDPSAKMAA